MYVNFCNNEFNIDLLNQDKDYEILGIYVRRKFENNPPIKSEKLLNFYSVSGHTVFFVSNPLMYRIDVYTNTISNLSFYPSMYHCMFVYYSLSVV